MKTRNKTNQKKTPPGHPLFWKRTKSKDGFTGKWVVLEGWSHQREPHHDHTPGIYDSYISALAGYMGLWEEYCEWHRLHPVGLAAKVVGVEWKDSR